MTDTAQTHTELDALLARVKTQVKECELTQAILIDDNLAVELKPEQWIRAVTKLRDEDAAAHGRLRNLYRENDLANVEEPPSEEIEAAAISLVEGSASEGAKAIIKERKYKESALDKLVALLTEVGLDVVCYTGIAGAPRTGMLYFLDYRMDDTAENAGKHAATLLKELVGREGQTPPSAVLMSRDDTNQPSPEEWEQVARDAGYYRFNFRYLNKGKIEQGRMLFLFFLHELLESYPVGKKYYSQLQSLRTAAKSAADAAIAEIRQLNPAEFSIFAGSYLGDTTGRKASRHVLNLFLGLLDAEVKNNDTLEAGFRAFAEMLMQTPMPATKDKDTHKLHELHTRLLYDRSKWVLSGPVVYGDIYQRRNEPDAYYLVITPECDLDTRLKGGVMTTKTAQVLLIRGKLTAQPTEKHPESYVGMPFVSEKGTRYVRWQLREAVFAPLGDLLPKTPAPEQPDPNGYVKWGRLRNTEAEHVQQQYASDLMEVGLDDISGLTHARSIEFWHVRTGRPEVQMEDLVIVETITVKDEKLSYYWAFAEGCDLLLCPDTPGEVFFAFADMIKLRKPTPKTEFLAECKRRQLQFIETDGQPPRFVRSKTGLGSGKSGWKPKTAAKDQSTAEGVAAGNASATKGQEVAGDKVTETEQQQKRPSEDGNPDQNKPRPGDRPSPPGKVEMTEIDKTEPPAID